MNHPDAIQWACYIDSGRGLFSRKFVAAVGSESLQGFTLLPATLNGCPYFFLRIETPIDCLNRTASQVETFPSDPLAIMEITHYDFYTDRLPECALFSIPEMPDLFATDGAAQRIEKSGLRGILLELLP